MSVRRTTMRRRLPGDGSADPPGSNASRARPSPRPPGRLATSKAGTSTLPVSASLSCRTKRRRHPRRRSARRRARSPPTNTHAARPRPSRPSTLPCPSDRPATTPGRLLPFESAHTSHPPVTCNLRSPPARPTPAPSSSSSTAPGPSLLSHRQLVDGIQLPRPARSPALPSPQTRRGFSTERASMHPRNPYLTPPDFSQLARAHPTFAR